MWPIGELVVYIVLMRWVATSDKNGPTGESNRKHAPLGVLAVVLVVLPVVIMILLLGWKAIKG